MNTDSAAPVDLDDTLAVVAYGSDAIDAALDARLTDALADTGAATLVARLRDLHRAMQAGKPREIRRATGLLGRLLGRDVEAEAEAEALQQRLGVLIADADRSAAGLRTHATRQQALQQELAQGIASIVRSIKAARDWLDCHAGAGATHPSHDRLEHRLDQLATVLATWQIGAQQLQLLHRQHLDLLARYQRIRDVLLPAWRQQALADATAAGAQHASAAADAQGAIESEVAAMAATLTPSTRTDPGSPA